MIYYSIITDKIKGYSFLLSLIIKNYQFDSKDDQISNLIRPRSDDLFK